ncbi:retrovirus-related pol polyprotein from transposon TNT 1-94 [Tanacetum coccineum]
MAAAADLDKIEEVNANCILMANLQQASTLGTQTDNAPVYDTDGSAEVQLHENCYNNEIFNMFTQEEQYTELLEPIPEPHQVPQNDSNVISEISSMAQGGGTVEQHSVNVEETRAYHESLFHNLAVEVEKVNSVNRKMKETNAELTTELARYKNQERCFEISQEKCDKLERCYQQSVYQEQCLSKKINALHLSSAKFVRDFQSLANEANKSLAKHKALELEIERLLRAVVSEQKDTSNGVDITTKTRRPQPRSNTKNDRVLSASKSSSIKNKEVDVEDHPRNLMLSKKKKHMSSECNNIKLAIRNDKSEIVYAMCKQCLVTANHDACMLKYVNGKNSRGKKQKANVSNIANQLKHKAQVIQICLWCVDSSCSKHMTGNLKLLINFVWKFLGTVHFGNDHVTTILSFSDLQWGNILITRVYFVEGLGHNLFSIGQFCDSDLEVTFRRNTCFIRNLEGVDLLKGNRITNLYTINLHDMATASPICLMARATSTKSWLWHQRLSHLNFDTINDLARNDLVTGLPKFKYHKEHLCPSCEQGKRKRASHPPKPVPNSNQRLHLLHMDLCGPMRIASINGKRYVLNQVLQEYFKSVGISHQPSSVRTPQQNGVVERRNRTLVEAARTMLIFSRAPLFLWAETIATACFTQNCSIIHCRFNKTPYELINGRKPDIAFLHIFRALCYPKNDREDIRKLGAKGGLDLPYAPSTITTQRPTESELDLLFEAMYDDHVGGQPSAAARTMSAAQVPQVLQTPSATKITADTAPTPTNSFSPTTSILSTSQNVDELKT